MNTPKQFASQLRAARGALGWTKRELSHRSGVSTTTLSKLENEGTGRHTETIQPVLKAFHEAGVLLRTAHGGRLIMIWYTETEG